MNQRSSVLTKKVALFTSTVLVLLGSVAGAQPTPDGVTARSVEQAAESLPAFMDALTDDLGVLPGASVAIVHEDTLVFASGFGVADVDTGAPFSATTPTYIASGSKAFLGLVIADLAEKGELDLHAPVGSTYLGDLDQGKLGAFASVTLHELLTHTHGINGDAISFRTAYTGDMSAELFWQIASQLPAEEDGNAFNYSNFGYVAAGYVLQRHLGLPWQDIVDQYVFEELGMHHSTARVSDLMEMEFAKPHIWYGETRRIPLYKRDASMHAAGGHFSTAEDMSRWLIANMNAGEVDGVQTVHSRAVKTILRPQAKLERQFFEYNRYAHGYGWYHARYGDEILYHHFGSFAGYRAHISFMPEHDLGVVVLSNDLSRPSLNLPDLIANYVYDTALGGDAVEEVYAARLTELDELLAPIRGRALPVRATNAPDDIAPYQGDFTHPTWGKVSMLNRDGALVMRWGQSENAPTWTTRDGTDYLRVEVAGRGYLLRPSFDDDGRVATYTFQDVTFTRR